MVCTGSTGHAEAVEVTFDPQKVTYEDLLSVFFENHDPTTRNRQGPDIGDQYRSVIYFTSPKQKVEAEKSRSKVEPLFSRPIVTKIVRAEKFWRAEEYHQKYVLRTGSRVC